MKVQYIGYKWESDSGKEVEVSDLIMEKLNDRDYYAGEMETLKSEVNNLKRMVSTLVAVLHEKHRIKTSELGPLIGLPSDAIKRISKED